MQGAIITLAIFYTFKVGPGNSFMIPDHEVSFSIPPEEKYGVKDITTMKKGKHIYFITPLTSMP